MTAGGHQSWVRVQHFVTQSGVPDAATSAPEGTSPWELGEIPATEGLPRWREW